LYSHIYIRDINHDILLMIFV